MEGVVVDKILFRFVMYGSLPEIFAIKVESCQKSRRILDVFSPSKILGAAFQNLYPFYHQFLTAHRLEKVLWGYSH